MCEQTDSHRGPTGIPEAAKAPIQDSVQGHNVSHFLRDLFRLLDENGIRYCVLHSWETLPEDLPSDLDLAVHPGDRAKLALVFGALRDKEFPPVQCLNYAVNAYYFVFYWCNHTEFQSVAVDIIFEHRRGGLILTSGEKLVCGRKRGDLFWVPDPLVELHYLLAKKTLKRSVSLQQGKRLKNLVEEVGRRQAQKVATRLYGKKWGTRVVEACLNGTFPIIVRQLVWPLRRTAVLQNPVGPVRNLFGYCIRLVRRWLHPTGLFLVILGPDGVGKSTLIAQLVQRIGPAFRRHRIFHWRPQVIGRQEKTGVPVTEPHAKPVRGTLGSVARLAVFCADFWLGYLLVIGPLLARSGLVIFDRYFHDIMIDNKRYRYGGPLWLPRMLARFVPPPNLLFLVLDADVDVLLSRKREVDPADLGRQRTLYIDFATKAPHAGLINTGSGIEQSLADALRTIALYMGTRYERQHRYWLVPAKLAREGRSTETIRP